MRNYFDKTLRCIVASRNWGNVSLCLPYARRSALRVPSVCEREWVYKNLS